MKSYDSEGLPLLLVKRAVKDFVKENGFQASREFIPAVNRKLVIMLSEAVERARRNTRKTLRPHDL